MTMHEILRDCGQWVVRTSYTHKDAFMRGVAVDLYTHTWRPSLLWERPVT